MLLSGSLDNSLVEKLYIWISVVLSMGIAHEIIVPLKIIEFIYSCVYQELKRLPWVQK